MAESKQKQFKGSKMSIGRKITLVNIASAAIITFVGIGLIYFFSSNLLMRMMGKEYSQVAKTLGALTANTLANEIEDAKSYAARLLWVDTVTEVDLKYSNMNEADIANYMADMDKKWSTAGKDSLFLMEYLQNRAGMGMRDAVQVRGSIAEIFITDKYGGLVASSDKTSDFYQADEEWWKKAYNGGKGDIFVGDVEFDDSSGYWVIPIAVPVVNRNKEVIGVLKHCIAVDRLFGSLIDFKIGNTGHALLMNGEGRILFHHGIGTMKEYIFKNDGFDALAMSPRPYRIITDKALDNKRTLAAFAKIDSPYLSKGDVNWFMLVMEEWADVSRPLDKLMIAIVIAAVFMLILTVPAGYLLGRLITRPIEELRAATERIMAGDLDYVAKIRTGDEIEQLADAFNRMIADIKNKQEDLKNFSRGLETKVEERTSELSAAQEATLNIMDDLQKTKENLEKTNKELLKLDQLKSDFISTVSHELRTPLSIIKEGISLVLDKIPGEVSEKQAKILSISKYNIDRLARIINSLLDISKIESGKVELRMGLVNVSDIVKETADSFEGAIKDKALEMRLDLDKTTGSVYADSDKIAQVLVNLIGNAVKFTPSGSISISCKDKGDAVICSVADTGPGISKDDIPKVFSKFQQFGRTAGAGDKGTGLGLSIAKSLIDMHNGTIWVESQDGSGAKFTFKLRKYNTSQSLFGEYVAKAVNKAADEDARLSIIAMNSSIVGVDKDDALKKKSHDVIHESARLIKNSLRREGDDVINSDGEMIIILANCDKESSSRVQHRLEETIDKYLVEQKMDSIVKLNYGYATYPDDGKSEMELLAKARMR